MVESAGSGVTVIVLQLVIRASIDELLHSNGTLLCGKYGETRI